MQTKNIQLAKTTENNRAVDFSTGTTEGLKKQAKTTENNIDMICNDIDMINKYPSPALLDGVRARENAKGK